MTLALHQDWSAAAFDLPPVAPRTGPFPGRRFTKTWWKTRGAGDLLIAQSSRALMPLMLTEARLTFVGEPDLCDYHSPLGQDAAALTAELCEALPPGTRLDFDSLPAEAATPIVEGLEAGGAATDSTRHQTTAVLPLPPDPDAWLASLTKKQRHEIRRKQRRFTAAAGTPQLVTGQDAAADIEVFTSLHRKAAGDKGSFMDESQVRWFDALVADVGAQVDLLLGEDGVPVAAAVGFIHDNTYYLYNSAYDPARADLSPGIVLVTLLITRSIRTGHDTFDFLKGDEAYKYNLGAVPRPLYAVSATVGPAS